MDNTKTAEEMDDFEATLDQYIHAHIGLTLHAPITTPMDKGECKYMLRQMYSDYVTPLKKTIQELEDVHVSELHIIYDLKKRIEEEVAELYASKATEELRKENEELQTQVSMFQTDRSERIEEMKRLKESNKELVEALVDLIKVTSCYRVGEIKETLYLVEQKTFLKAEKLIKKSEGDLLKVIIDKSKELDAEQKSHTVTNTDQLRINAIGKSEGDVNKKI